MSDIDDVRKYLESKVEEFSHYADEHSYQSSLEVADFGVDDGSANVSYSYRKAAQLCQHFVNLIKIEEIKDKEDITLTKIVEFLDISVFGINDAVNKYKKEHKND